MPRIEQSIVVNAPVERVYEVARDVESFPDIMEDLQSLKVLETSDDGNRTLTEWVGVVRQFRMTLKWVQEDVWDPSRHRDEFRSVRGDVNHSGHWQFTPEDGGTRFESVVDYKVDVPLVGPMVQQLIRKLMEANLGAQMQAIKEKAERNA